MKVIILLLLLLAFSQTGLYSQENKDIPPSIRKEVTIIREWVKNNKSKVLTDSIVQCILDSVYADSTEQKDPFTDANYNLNRAERNFQNSNFSEARSDIQKCIDICNNQIDLTEKVDSSIVFIRSSAYLLMAKLTFELNLIHQSSHYIHSSIEDLLLIGDTKSIASNYLILSKLYTDKSEYDLAEEFIHLSNKYNSGLSYNVNIEVNNLLSLAEIHFVKGNNEEAKVLIDKASKLSDGLSFKALSSLELKFADYYIKVGMFDSVDYYIQKAEYNMITNNIKYLNWNIIRRKIKSSIAKGDYLEALTQLNQFESSINTKKVFGYNIKKLGLLKYKIEIYKKLKEYDNVILYQDELYKFSDSLNVIKSIESVKMLENINEIESKSATQKIELLKLEDELKNDILFISILLFVLIIVVMILILISYKSRLVRKKKELLERDSIIKDLEINQQKQELEELSKHAVSTSMLIEAKNNIYQGLKEFLVDTKSQLSLDNTHYNKLKIEIDSSLRLDNDWDQMTKHYNDINTRFYQKLQLKCPELTNEELKLCAYLRLNLSSKDIARMLNITDDAITKRRHRLRKKLELGSDENLFRLFNDESFFD